MPYLRASTPAYDPGSRTKDQAGQKRCCFEMYACIVHAPSVKLLSARIMTGKRNFIGNFVQRD